MGSRGKMYWTNYINESVPASESVESDHINISGCENFAIVIDSVSGDFSVEYKASLTDTGPFLDTGTLVSASVTEAAFIRFNPVLAPFIKFIVTNNSAVVTGTISVTLVHRVA